MSSSDLPTDHRRSDNHSESHQPQTLRSRCIGDTRDRTTTGQAPCGRNSPQFAEMGSHTSHRRSHFASIPFGCGTGFRTGPARRGEEGRRERGGDILPDRRRGPRCACATGPRRNAPSRWRLRPAFRLTAAEAAADRRAINLGRSVLGASRTLGRCDRPVKESGGQRSRNLRCFLFTQVELRLLPHDLALKRRKRPGTQGPAARIRRAGNAFVHLPDEPSASA